MNILSMDNSFVFLLDLFQVYCKQFFYLIKARAEIHHYKVNVRLCSFLGLKQLGEVKLELFISQLQKLLFLVKYQIIQISQYALACFRN